MDKTLANVTVVIPVGPGDQIAPELQADLQPLARQTRVRVVCASATGAQVLRSAMAPLRHWEVVSAPPGRATQQNAGAAGVDTDYLWFLHADSRLADGTLPTVAAFLARGEYALGYFDLRFLDGPRRMRLNEAGAWLRSRWLGLPFGDQGLVIPRFAFEALAGFDPRVQAGEDHDLIWRTRRLGLPLVPLHAPLYTSARRYTQQGWWRTTSQHVRATWRQARQFSRGSRLMPRCSPETPRPRGQGQGHASGQRS